MGVVGPGFTVDPAGVVHVDRCPVVDSHDVSSSGRGPCTCVPGQAIPRTVPHRSRKYDPRAVAEAVGASDIKILPRGFS